PGPIAGREQTWGVTSRGGSEKILIVASVQPLPAMERTLERIPRVHRPAQPRDATAVAVRDSIRDRDDDIVSDVTAHDADSSSTLTALSLELEKLRSSSGGIWFREIALDNEGP